MFYFTDSLVVDRHVPAVESLIRERLGHARDRHPRLVLLGSQGAELALCHRVTLPPRVVLLGAAAALSQGETSPRSRTTGRILGGCVHILIQWCQEISRAAISVLEFASNLQLCHRRYHY